VGGTKEIWGSNLRHSWSARFILQTLKREFPRPSQPTCPSAQLSYDVSSGDRMLPCGVFEVAFLNRLRHVAFNGRYCSSVRLFVYLDIQDFDLSLSPILIVVFRPS
jgi:hypothetical protein